MDESSVVHLKFGDLKFEFCMIPMLSLNSKFSLSVGKLDLCSWLWDCWLVFNPVMTLLEFLAVVAESDGFPMH